MSFRLEEKLSINQRQINEFIYWINKNKAQQIYPPRIVQSIYFENYNNDIYLDSEEGCVPRKKIRIRNYPELNNEEYFFEIKISSIEGRFKKTNKINKDLFNKYLKKGFFDNYYGTCRPKVTVSYLRQYYKIWGMRLTIDKNINYQNYSSKVFKAFDTEVIVELKSDNIFEKEKIQNKFPNQKIRFSKYCRSFKFFN